MMEHRNMDCIDYLKTLGDRSIDMMVIDPPYYKVVRDDWDHQWSTEEEYYEWCRHWLSELGRTAKYSCSLWLFGYPKHLFHLLPYIESRGFKFKQQIVIAKGLRAAAGRIKSSQRMYPTTTESIFYFYYESRPYIADILKSEKERIGVSVADINKFLGKPNSGGGGVFSALTASNKEGQSYPTEEYWDVLSQIMHLPPYRDVVYTFNSQKGLSDVWCDIDFYREKNRIHSTQKPIALIQRIVNASSNPGDTVLDIFTGSGTTPLVCKLSGRDFRGCEIDRDYYEKAEERLDIGIIP